MNIFTDVYSKSRSVLASQSLAEDWRDIQDKLKALLAAGGPDVGKAAVLDDVRRKIKAGGKGRVFGAGGEADAIIAGSEPTRAKVQERAALLKTMCHFYLVAKKGNQNIWVVDCPKDYGQWAYDQLSGKTDKALKQELKKANEVFGNKNRAMMSDALQLARKWASDVEIKLGAKDDAVKAAVKRWFHEDSAEAAAIESSIATLSTGFRKIHGACNSSQVIFSDRPHYRSSGDYDNVYASVNGGDVMPVIYVYQLFLRKGRKTLFGNIPDLWYCALTIIHELSHKLAKTDDHRYDDDGLKPSKDFPSGKAIANADSWAYLAADLMGALSTGTLQRVLK